MQGSSFDFSWMRVLTVENHALMRKLLNEMLRSFGAGTVREARNVGQALDLAYDEHFDLVILDFFLGGSSDPDGADFAAHLRGDAACPNRTVPILLVTAQPDHHKVAKARDAGINAMLAKPIAARDLYWRIVKLMATPRENVRVPGGARDPARVSAPAR